MSIDIEEDFESDRAAFATAQWQLFFLAHVPDAVSRGHLHVFSNGLIGQVVEGFEL